MAMIARNAVHRFSAESCIQRARQLDEVGGAWLSTKLAGDTVTDPATLAGRVRALQIEDWPALFPAIASPREVGGWIYGASEKLTANGPIFNNGDTSDVGDDAALRVQFADTRSGPAYHLSLHRGMSQQRARS